MTAEDCKISQRTRLGSPDASLQYIVTLLICKYVNARAELTDEYTKVYPKVSGLSRQRNIRLQQ
jgi:hypothetical protein